MRTTQIFEIVYWAIIQTWYTWYSFCYYSNFVIIHWAIPIIIIWRVRQLTQGAGAGCTSTPPITSHTVAHAVQHVHQWTMVEWKCISTELQITATMHSCSPIVFTSGGAWLQAWSPVECTTWPCLTGSLPHARLMSVLAPCAHGIFRCIPIHTGPHSTRQLQGQAWYSANTTKPRGHHQYPSDLVRMGGSPPQPSWWVNQCLYSLWFKRWWFQICSSYWPEQHKQHIFSMRAYSGDLWVCRG